MPVPNTFANATTSIPLSQLDNNFATPITIGNTAVQLGNTVTTLNNITFANVAITSGTINANATAATVDSVNVVGYMGIPQNSQNGNYNIVIVMLVNIFIIQPDKLLQPTQFQQTQMLRLLLERLLRLLMVQQTM
jgi:hypothetical protein